MPESSSERRTRRRYRALAPAYDWLSLEHVLYRRGREAAVRAARLQPGQHVLDVGCGTGLTMPSIASRLGPTGHVIGIDSNAAMLGRASKRQIDVRQTLILADAQNIDREILIDHRVTGSPHAALFCYSLSVMPERTRAWEHVIRLMAPGARVAIADVAPPTRGGAPARLVARTLARIGRSDIDSRPWTSLQESCTDIEHHTYAGGHVHVWAGSLL